MSQIRSIQALRAVAALAVTFGHLEHEASSLPSATVSGFAPVLLDLTGAGVDLFFVVSGFVMVHASRDLFERRGAALVFLGRRLARIVPLYWMATTLFLLAMLGTHALSSSPPTFAEVVKSYLFVPYLPHDGAAAQPVYKLGWTLNYEMFFYLVFSLALTLPVRAAVLALALLFAGLAVLGVVFAPPAGPLAFWTHPIILEFVFGAGAALAYREGLRFGRRSASLAIAAGLAGFAATTLSGMDPHGPWRPAVWGVPAALIFVGFVLGGQARSPGRFTGRPAAALVALGDASYALYLLHPLVVRALRLGFDKLHADTFVSPWAFVGLGLGLAVLLACLVHRGMERPLTRRLSRLLGTRPGQPQVAGPLPV